MSHFDANCMGDCPFLSNREKLLNFSYTHHDNLKKRADKIANSIIGTKNPGTSLQCSEKQKTLSNAVLDLLYDYDAEQINHSELNGTAYEAYKAYEACKAYEGFLSESIFSTFSHTDLVNDSGDGLDVYYDARSNFSSSLSDLENSNTDAAVPISKSKKCVPDFQNRHLAKSDSCLVIENSSKKCDCLLKVPEQNMLFLPKGSSTTTIHQLGTVSSGRLLTNTNRRSHISEKDIIEEIASSDFKVFFNYFAKLGQRLKSGTVITRSNSNNWLKRAGLIFDVESEKMANQSFNKIARQKLVLNISDYVLYLLMFSRDIERPLYEMVKKLKSVNFPKTKQTKR